MADTPTLTMIGDGVFKYPNARRGDKTTRSYENKKGHTVSIPEPYDWLEDPDSKETGEWVTKEVEMFSDYIKDVPMKKKCADMMRSMLTFERFSTPYRVGNSYFYRHNTGLQNHSVLYVLDKLDGEPRALIDPNKLSEDATTALKENHLTKDGSLNCYSLSKGGSDWVTLHVMNVETGKACEDVLKHCKFTSVAWTHDNKGFFYVRYPDPKVDDLGTETTSNENHQIYYHLLGTPQAKDVFFISAEQCGDAKWMFGVEMTDDGKHLVIDVSQDCDPINKFWAVDLEEFDPSAADKFAENFEKRINKVVDNFDAQYAYLGNDGSTFYCKTNLKAEKKRVIKLDIMTKEVEELIPEQEEPLESVCMVNKDMILTVYMKDVTSQLRLFSVEGKEIKDVPLDFPNADLTISGDRSFSDIFIYETSFLTAGKIHYIDLAKEKKWEVFREAKVPGFNPADFTTEQVFYASKDGTKIPMFIIRKAGAERDGSSPALLYGYGGFNISITPYFSVSRVLWCTLFNGTYCIANIRGGAEYGEGWHKQGILDRKQNVFDDFISAGEFLVAEKYTSAGRLCIEGGSNGGLLVGACCNQRPDLISVGLAHVGVMDMLRFHKFTIGYAWTSDYGSADKPEEFDALYAYSPLHNIPKMKEGEQYPAFLGLTADHDDRVVPLHTMKFMAELQHKVGLSKWQEQPLLTRIEVKAGHGAGTSLDKAINERSDIFAFVSKVLKLE